jgi:hypothetical protein
VSMGADLVNVGPRKRRYYEMLIRGLRVFCSMLFTAAGAVAFTEGNTGFGVLYLVTAVLWGALAVWGEE